MRKMIFLLVLFLSAAAVSQECTSSVVINVFDDRLRLDVRTLAAEDFQARMDNHVLPIVNLEQDYNSRLLVLLETDGTNNSKVQDVVETITTMARQAPEGKPVIFGIYAERALFTKSFEAAPDKRTADVNSIIEEANSMGKRVALFDALHEALQLFGEHQAGDTILLVADPYDDKSSRSQTEIEKEFLGSGTRLMAMVRRPMSLVGRGDLQIDSHEREKSFFLDFAERTGGAHSEFDPRFFGFTWRGYMLELKAPKAEGKAHPWSLKLNPGVRAAFRHTKIFYPELLPPCRVAAASRKPE